MGRLGKYWGDSRSTIESVKERQLWTSVTTPVMLSTDGGFSPGAIDVEHVPESDDYASGTDSGVVRGIDDDLGEPAARWMFQTEDQEIHPSLEVELIEPLAGPLGRGMNLDFFNAQGLALFLDQDVQETDSMRPDGFTSHPQSSNLTGRNGGVRTRFHHAFRKFSVGCSGDNSKPRKSLASEHSDYQVVLVERQRGYKAFGTAQPTFLKNIFFGRIADGVGQLVKKVAVSFFHLAKIVF